MASGLFHWIYTHGVVMAAFVGLAFLLPRLGDSLFKPVEAMGTRLARKKSLAIFSVALTAIFLRVVLLWYVPVPHPKVVDEFSYLLAADTFAHGRLTNPPHSMWKFFETFHVLQLPTYMSKFPPAQGAFLALGQLLGGPWIGVLLSTAAMYAAILWMLQGWVPPRWAFLGVILMLLRMGIFNYWVDSYWGGAVAAMGGALVMGALPRIWRRQHPRDAIALALGAGILANTRPYEGLIFFVPVAFALIWWLFTRRLEISWGTKALRIVAPAGLTLALIVAFGGYYNWRVTGNPVELPYSAYEKQYDPLPLFVWQEAGPPNTSSTLNSMRRTTTGHGMPEPRERSMEVGAHPSASCGRPSRPWSPSSSAKSFSPHSFSLCLGCCETEKCVCPWRSSASARWGSVRRRGPFPTT